MIYNLQNHENNLQSLKTIREMLGSQKFYKIIFTNSREPIKLREISKKKKSLIQFDWTIFDTTQFCKYFFTKFQ